MQKNPIVVLCRNLMVVVKYKVVVVGDGGVGKSCLTLQFVHNKFATEYDPTIESFYRKNLNIGDEHIVVEVLDTAGQDEYSAMADQYVKSGQGFLIVYSIANRKSFTKAEWYFQVIERVKERREVPRILVGNKCDVDDSERKVTKQEGEELAQNWECPFIETSAKSRIRHEDAFLTVVNLMREQRTQKNLGNETPRDSVKRKKKCTIL